MIPPPHCLQKKRKNNAKNCFYLFILPDCSRFNSGPQRYAWVETPRTCKGDLIWKTIFAHIFWDEITQDLKWGLVCLYVLSGVLLSATPWTVALQASLSVEFSMPEYWSGLPCSILRQERSPGEGNGNPLQYSCLGNPTIRGAWWVTVHGVTRVGHAWVTTPPPAPYKALGTMPSSQELQAPALPVPLLYSCIPS